MALERELYESDESEPEGGPNTPLLLRRGASLSESSRTSTTISATMRRQQSAASEALSTIDASSLEYIEEAHM